MNPVNGSSDVETRTIKLRRPIKAFDQELTELTIREPTPADLLAMDKATGEVAKVNALLSKVCNVPASTICQLKMRDYNRLLEALAALGFTGESEDSDD